MKLTNSQCEPLPAEKTAQHAQLVGHLADLAYPTGSPWSKQTIQSDMQLSTSQYWLVKVASEPVGFLSGTFLLDQAELTNLGVVPDWQHQGLAKLLLKTWLERLPINTTVTLEVRQHNHAAYHLYISLGFVEIAKRTAYYDRPVEDALIMQMTT
ncbi:ribosomal protein S18-alanine N-acetyltransferase [Furfurilactobacillus siliginis]|uniref:[Ribosomal protein bS18]-alanine N-acetyltransferase n=1 Tax=Furfurilactobacillus siliginis TaxID=348151 RepID=A0A0R2L4I3_9LACO|nr:ribosomal protein S18-alanine N-acetyltransferase [Furfurilactobacillus siliginis]KRN96579.1 hypothetical protein IV55_GL001098 [Furfurilactobacillus siliginis]GEK29493.1 ribosomal-protein-alanine acetyltransferase [Furfurilactobacillus siliginis]